MSLWPRHYISIDAWAEPGRHGKILKKCVAIFYVERHNMTVDIHNLSRRREPTVRRDPMFSFVRAAVFAVAAIVMAGGPAASAQSLSESDARAIIAPWYSLFNVATRGDVKTIEEQALTP